MRHTRIRMPHASLIHRSNFEFPNSTFHLQRSQLTTSDGGKTHYLMWLNTLLFASLTALYGWFCFFEPPRTFDSLESEE